MTEHNKKHMTYKVCRHMMLALLASNEPYPSQRKLDDQIGPLVDNYPTLVIRRPGITTPSLKQFNKNMVGWVTAVFDRSKVKRAVLREQLFK